jgi:hypothetical protein
MFTEDLCVSPSTRNEASVTHAVAAVGSRSLQKAQDFIRDTCPDGAAGQTEGHVRFKPKAYGSYKEVVDDSVCLHLLTSLLGKSLICFDYKETKTHRGKLRVEREAKVRM